MNCASLVPVVILAQATEVGFVNALVNFGALGCWVLWLLWRDKRDSDKRDLQHSQNQESQAKIHKALRDITTSLMVSVEAMTSADQTIHELAAKLKERNNQET